MNLPNKLTVLRICLIPVFIVFVSLNGLYGHSFYALAVFALASFTDYLDGNIARKRGLVTDFGKFMDPLADKILTTTAIIYMCIAKACHPIVLVLILAREFAVSGVRMVAAAGGGKVIAANMWGKVKTVMQMITIILYYFVLGLLEVGIIPDCAECYVLLTVNILMWVVAAVTVLSGWQYIWANREYIKTAE